METSGRPKISAKKLCASALFTALPATRRGHRCSSMRWRRWGERCRWPSRKCQGLSALSSHRDRGSKPGTVRRGVIVQAVLPSCDRFGLRWFRCRRVNGDRSVRKQEACIALLLVGAEDASPASAFQLPLVSKFQAGFELVVRARTVALGD